MRRHHIHILCCGYLYSYLLLSVNGLTIEEKDRVDCLPGMINGDMEGVCGERGCVWEPSPAPSPSCYIGPDYGYRAVGELVDTEFGKAVDLKRANQNSLFGGDFQSVRVEFHFQTEERLRVKIFPVGEERYEVPIQITGGGVTSQDVAYQVEATYEPVFSFRIIRKSTGTVIFDSSLGGLTIADQFLQIAAKLPSENVYGFAEQEQSSFKHNMEWKTWGMFARDQAPEGDANLYGVHPRYTVLEEDGNTHGVLILNSNAQDVTLTPAPGLVYRTIGGILDLYFFLGPSPESVVSQYTEAVGRFYVPPYWSLGFHLCRWGYNTLENMEAAWQRTLDAGIPFDAQWGDIDIMDRRLDFTVNPTEFAGLPQFVDRLHEIGMKFVTILDPCISTGEEVGTYPAFDVGNELDVWIKNSSGAPLAGFVWPDNATYFPDYFNPITQEWWIDQIEQFHDLLAWDGLWIDMNEPSNFVVGSVDGCPDNKWNNPPYKPKSNGDTLTEKTICLDAEQYGGRHYDVHSMFGWSQTKPTLSGVQAATGKRGIALSRSTYIGSGQWTAHWLGDNWSEWDNLHFSIIGMLQFNQFGIPLVGADICGFIGNATEEMCARWQQLGAFYPFSRNHNLLDSIDQDPGVWEGGLVGRVARKALELKYFFLPYLYSLFYRHTLQGGTVVRPVWHEFPGDSSTWHIDTQFLWGEAIMVSPIILQGQTSRQVYLPPTATWYDLSTLAEVPGGDVTVTSDLANENDTVPIHLRGGFVIPGQAPGKNTAESMAIGSYRIVVALDGNGMAEGELYLDDGDSINPDHLHSKLVFSVTPGSLEGVVERADYLPDNLKLDEIIILGVKEEVSQVVVNNGLEAGFDYDRTAGVLRVFPGGLALLQDVSLQWF